MKGGRENSMSGGTGSGKGAARLGSGNKHS